MDEKEALKMDERGVIKVATYFNLLETQLNCKSTLPSEIFKDCICCKKIINKKRDRHQHKEEVRWQVEKGMEREWRGRRRINRRDINTFKALAF